MTHAVAGSKPIGSLLGSCAARIAVLALGVLLLLVRVAASAEPDATEERALGVARALGYNEKEIRDLLAGKVVSRQLREEAKDELAVTLAVRSPLSSAVVYEELVRHDFFSADRTILMWGVIPEGPLDANSFARLQLPEGELNKLAKAKPGTEFNLSSSELAAFAEIVGLMRGEAKARRNEELMRSFREILATRAEAYREHGIDGVASYARKGETLDPRPSLRAAIPQPDSQVGKQAPEFREVLAGYPKVPLGNIGSELLWFLQEINGRPAIILAHRIHGRASDNAFSAQRDFYVMHNFHALQTVVGTMAFGGASLIFYGNWTYTEQVAGFASGAAHKIGRRMLIGEVETLAKEVVAKMRSQADE